MNKAKQTFANLPVFGCIREGLMRLYVSYSVSLLGRNSADFHRAY